MVMPPEPGNPKAPPFKIINLPVSDVRDIERGLKQLMSDIGEGKYGTVHNVVWIADRGNGKVEFGLLGYSGEPGLTAHLLMSIAQHNFISSIAGCEKK